MLNREIIILTDSFSERRRKKVFFHFSHPGRRKPTTNVFLKNQQEAVRYTFSRKGVEKNLVDQRGLYTNKYLEAFNGNYPEAEV